MKTVNNQEILLYDSDCPLCSAYTKGFMHLGMLKVDGRMPYQDMDERVSALIDPDRARNEIALVNLTENKVRYGLDSLLKIIGSRMPFVERICRTPPLYWLLKYCYNFISYNRKVIMPKKVSTGKYQCIPDFNMGYRITYLLFAWGVTSMILGSYSKLLGDYLTHGSINREMLICGGQIFFQYAVIAAFPYKNKMEYLGNLMTISLGGAVLLLPMIAIAKYQDVLSETVYLIYFGTVAGLMFAEHVRRSKISGFPKLLSATWILYRLIVLYIIL